MLGPVRRDAARSNLAGTTHNSFVSLKGIIMSTALRPTSLDSDGCSRFIGQRKAVDQITDLLKAAKLRGELPDHILLQGPPGVGKTSLAALVADSLGAKLRPTSGSSCKTVGDMGLFLTGLDSGDVAFIDEIHSVFRPAEELLGLAMEDGQIAIAGHRAPVKVAPFVLVGATTLPGKLSGPLKGRFPLTCNLSFYSQLELAEIIRGNAERRAMGIEDDAVALLARRSRGTARTAVTLLRKARDQATIARSATITEEHAVTAMRKASIDAAGLDAFDVQVLDALTDRWSGRTVGLAPLAAFLGRDVVDAMTQLGREGFAEPAAGCRGWFATPEGFAHLNRKPPVCALFS
jgi:Holliday junction DNA helicase RuvB